MEFLLESHARFAARQEKIGQDLKVTAGLVKIGMKMINRQRKDVAEYRREMADYRREGAEQRKEFDRCIQELVQTPRSAPIRNLTG